MTNYLNSSFLHFIFFNQSDEINKVLIPGFLSKKFPFQLLDIL